MFFKSFVYQTPDALCYVTAHPISAEYALPYDNPRSVIDGIHQMLTENQGLIAVEKGKTNSGHRFIYSVVKSLKKPSSMQYCLTMHVECEEFAVLVQGFFVETSMTEDRSTKVYITLLKRGLIRPTENGVKGWSEDPYDPEYTHGLRMNRSERKEYDGMFPHHPLSELRRFVGELAVLN